MRLVVLQPFYLPYAGVFELVRLADTFVLYDDVQFVPRNWQVRNRIKTADGPRWLTVPVHRDRRDVPINEVEIDREQPWREKHWRSIELAYARASNFTVLGRHLQPCYDEDWKRLVDLDTTTFALLCELVGVSATFLRSSQLGVPGRGSERIVALCRELGATSYLSGPSARDYLDEGSFEQAGVELEYFAFDHPTYTQLHGEFEPSLSVIDLIANVGPAAGGVLAGRGRGVPAAEFAA